MDRARIADEKHGVVCLYWTTHPLGLDIFRVKTVNFRHFECDVIVFQLRIFNWILTDSTYVLEYFPYMYGYATLNLTGKATEASKNAKNVLSQQKLAVFAFLEASVAFPVRFKAA